MHTSNDVIFIDALTDPVGFAIKDVDESGEHEGYMLYAIARDALVSALSERRLPFVSLSPERARELGLFR